MNAFSLKTMFVAKTSGVATTGSTQDLTAAQIGIFLPDYTVANAGNIAAADYFYIAQGRIEQVPGLGSKRSDKISPDRVIKWFKVSPEDTAANKIVEVSDFSAKC